MKPNDDQLELLPLRALSRATDEITSRIAAAGQTNRATHLRRMLEAYRQRPMTDVEAAAIAGIERVEATRRASELRNTKLIEKVLTDEGQLVTRLLPSGRPGMVCQITSLGRDALRAVYS